VDRRNTELSSSLPDGSEAELPSPSWKSSVKLEVLVFEYVKGDDCATSGVHLKAKDVILT
jgi:hypothetical protein